MRGPNDWRRAVRAWGGILLCAALSAAIASGGCRRADPADRDEARDAAAEKPAERDEASSWPGAGTRILHGRAPGSFIDLAAELRDSVVHLRSPRPVSRSAGHSLGVTGADRALASGLLLDDEGHIVTSDHILEHARDIEVALPDGDARPAELVGRDARLGIALLEIEPAPALRAPPLGNSDALEVGEWVLATGDPLGDGQSVAAAVISSLGQGDSIAEPRPNPRALIRLDRDVSPESAGGPLVNMAGEVVGVVLPRASRESRSGQAAPLARILEVLPALVEHGRAERAWLGVFVHPVSEERAERRGLSEPRGALVSEVVAESPAEKAGLRPGDIIVEFGGAEVDHQTLPHAAARSNIGIPVAVEVRRNGQTKMLTVVTEAMPE